MILRSLEEAELVKRLPNATDRRAVVLVLTAKGQRIAAQRTGTVEAVFRKTLSKMRPRDVEIARGVPSSSSHTRSPITIELAG